jgi:hypothetical protein
MNFKQSQLYREGRTQRGAPTEGHHALSRRAGCFLFLRRASKVVPVWGPPNKTFLPSAPGAPSGPDSMALLALWNQTARGHDAPCVGRSPTLALPPGVTPHAAYAWACGHTAAPACLISTGPVCPEQAPAGREDTERAGGTQALRRTGSW